MIKFGVFSNPREIQIGIVGEGDLQVVWDEHLEVFVVRDAFMVHLIQGDHQGGPMQILREILTEDPVGFAIGALASGDIALGALEGVAGEVEEMDVLELGVM